MKRAGRKFDICVIGAGDVERLHAWKSPREVRFSYEDSRRLRRVRKRNTLLFDALADLIGGAYQLSVGVNEDMLYETIMVDFSQHGDVCCQEPAKDAAPAILPADELEKTLYEQGFHVEKQDGSLVHFVPFVASASMSREEEYLFVNADRLDALLRVVSLDMVAAVNGMPVVDGRPLEPDGESPFGALAEGRAMVSVPKLAAYLGLALSDGVSLREAYGGAKEEAWLLGLNEQNTVCVADWGNAPTHLDAFDYCWVNEEVTLQAGDIPSRSAGDKQTELQKRLQTLFTALYGTDRAAFDALMTAGDVCALWQQAIGRFFAGKAEVELKPMRIPHLQPGPQGASVHLAAVLYAACLYADEGEFLLSAASALSGDEQVLTQQELQDAVADLATNEEKRNRLWNVMHEQNPAENHVMEATSDEAGVHLKLRMEPCTMYRAELRHINFRDRHGNGNMYDGCGFLDDELFGELQALLGVTEPLNAVQIRLPWCKGLLVRFTATRFFREWALKQGADVPGMTITDVFGQQRPLFDAQGEPLVKAFFTASMFKGAGWFRHLVDQSPEGQTGDRWAEYWRRLRAHRTSLLIAGRSTPPGMKSRLNYQFLTTLGLEAGELNMLAERRLRELGEVLGMKADERADRLAELLMGLAAPEEEIPDLPEIPDAMDEESDADKEDAEEPEGTDTESGSDEEDYLRLLGKALRRHPGTLLNTSLVMERFDALVRSEVLQMMRGRLTVSGDVRYLLPDLMQVLRHMARHFLFRADGSRVGELARNAEASRATSLINGRNGNYPYGCYYAPAANVPWQHRTGRLGKAGTLTDVAILRNPHYAQGEAPILRPLAKDVREEYDFWFSHLVGCVIAPAAVMHTINGADCDGDRVNVCAEPVVLTAIRRRAKRENALLKAVISRRGEILSWLDTASATCRGKSQRRYLLRLREELPRILPEAEPEQLVIRDSFPPLVYAGSASGARYLMPQDLHGEKLRDRLWDAFCISRMQRIGQMSLRVLALTPDAYGDIPRDAEKGMLPPQLLACFLARYLVVSGALDTAMEIDMAKTGARRKDQPLLSVPVELRKQLAMRRRSGYLCWHRLCKDYERRLGGYGFSRALEEMMGKYCAQWKAPAAGWMAVDVLPRLVYHLFSPEKAARLCADPVEEKRRPVVQEHMLGSGVRRPLRRVLRQPTAGELTLLNAPRRDGSTLLGELRGLLKHYDQARRLQSRAQRACDGLDKAYQAVLRWLLTNGRSLDDALKAMELLRGMLNRWHGNHQATTKLLCDVLGMLQKLARDQSVAVQWGWTRDEAQRRGLLRGMLLRAHGVKEGELPAEMGFTAEEEALLLSGRRSIVLVRLVADYGWRETLMQQCADTGRAPTHDELEADLRAAIAREHPDRVDDLLCAACCLLRDSSYTDKSGRQCTMMSDFLLTYLLRAQLADVIVNPEEGGEQP
ncbi:MAG: hypothetical protein IJE07_00415 [Clostridia bacterium]|nr:hypothetical protein [Clostridia bacterium]